MFKLTPLEEALGRLSTIVKALSKTQWFVDHFTTCQSVDRATDTMIQIYAFSDDLNLRLRVMAITYELDNEDDKVWRCVVEIDDREEGRDLGDYFKSGLLVDIEKLLEDSNDFVEKVKAASP